MGADVKATLRVRVAMLDKVVPVVIERMGGPMPLHDLMHPNDAPHKASQPQIPVTGPQPVHSYFPAYQARRAQPSQVVGAVGGGRVTLSSSMCVGGPVRQTMSNAAAMTTCANLPVRLGGARASSVVSTGRLTPSFPLHHGGAFQPCGVAYQYGSYTPPAPKPSFASGTSPQVRMLGPITAKVA